MFLYFFSIKRMKEVGLIQKAIDDELFVAQQRSTKQIVYENTDSSIVLSLVELQGAFYVLIIGITIATFVFISEKIIQYG